MDLINYAILVGSGLLVISIFTSVISFRMGAPLLLVFLIVGLLAGEDGPGGITFNNPHVAFLIGSVALSIILFDTGFQTNLHSYRSAAVPAVVLATLGVVATTLILGVAARYVFDLPWLEAFLMAAIVSSTDAAAVFFLLRVGGITIRERVRSTLEIESGSNDPMAIFLVLGLVELAAVDHDASLVELARIFVQQFSVGALLGVAGGSAIVFILNRLRLDPGLYPVLMVGFVLLIFAATNNLGGSGFLATYVAGLIAGNRRLQGAPTLRRFQNGLTWLSQITMFVTLGLLATPSQFPSLMVPAMVLGAVLIFVARPLAVWLCLLPFRFSRQETAFVAWVGLRGAVSILLALVPIIGGLPNAQLFFNVAFLLVLISLCVQGWTIRPTAGWLGLIVPRRTGPVDRLELELPGLSSLELLAYKLHENSPVVRGQRLPRWARPVMIQRKGAILSVHNVKTFQPGDYLYLFAAPAQLPLLDKMFGGTVSIADDDHAFYGDFILKPDVTIGALAEMYGLPLTIEQRSMTIGELLRKEFKELLEVGDRLTIGDVVLIVREVKDGEVTSVGMAVDPASVAPPRIPVFQRPHEIARGLSRVRARLSALLHRWSGALRRRKVRR